MRGSRREGKTQENWNDARPPRYWERKNRTYNNNINYNEKNRKRQAKHRKKIISQQNRITEKQQKQNNKKKKKKTYPIPLFHFQKAGVSPFVIAGFDRGCFPLLRRFLAL